jgi:hypothetical protein
VCALRAHGALARTVPAVVGRTGTISPDELDDIPELPALAEPLAVAASPTWVGPAAACPRSRSMSCSSRICSISAASADHRLGSGTVSLRASVRTRSDVAHLCDLRDGDAALPEAWRRNRGVRPSAAPVGARPGQADARRQAARAATRGRRLAGGGSDLGRAGRAHRCLRALSNVEAGQTRFQDVVQEENPAPAQLMEM